MKKTFLALVGILCMLTASANPRTGLLIGYDSENNEAMNAQEKAACAMFKDLNPDGTIIPSGRTDLITTDNFDCIWVHIDRVGLGLGNLPAGFNDEATINALGDYLRNGGNLYLTKHATQLVSRIGRTDPKFALTIFGDGEGGKGTDVWAVQAQFGWDFKETDPTQFYDRRGHDIFRDMEEVKDADGKVIVPETFPLLGSGNNTDLWREDHNCMWDFNAYNKDGNNLYTSDGKNNLERFEKDNNAVALGTWGQVRDHACAGIIEFLPVALSRANETGTIIANGLAAYELAPREGTNGFTDNIRKLTANSINYLATKTTTGIEDVTVADTDAAKEYFNLQGMRVDAESLTPGLYIVRQGNNSTKILVK